MQVFVLRHGQAETQQTTDEARNLTQKGRADVAASINYALGDLKKIQEIWASPLVRAQQTAQIAQELLLAQGVNVSIKTTDLITPESDKSGLFDSLQSTESDSILLASHQPFVGGFLDVFCGSVRGSHPMETSSLALVECDVAAANCGELRWLRHVHG
jgi:phosphohistidine phosphatase